MLKPLLVLTGAVSFFSFACLTNTQTNTLQTDLEGLRAQVLILQKEHAALRDQIAAQVEKIQAALDARGEDRQEGRAEMLTRLDSMRNEMDVLVQKLEDTNYRLSALSGDIQATRRLFSYGQMPVEKPPSPVGDATAAGDARAPAPPPATGGSPVGNPMQQTPERAPPAGASPGEIYNTAYADYTKGNYPLAILGFQEYLEKFGNSDFADDALYWVGESYYSQGKFSDAIVSFEDLIRRYPRGDKVPAAHLKKGLAYLESNRTAQGVVQLSALVQNYPGTDEARLARERLRAMGLRDR